MRSILFGLMAATLVVASAAAQPATVTFEFERTDIGVWSVPAGRISDDLLMLGVPQGEREADAQLWFWSRERGVFSQPIPSAAEGIVSSGCGTTNAVVWLSGERRGAGYQSYLRRLDFANGEFQINTEHFSPVNAITDVVDAHYTMPVARGPERGIYFARGGCRLISTNTLSDLIARMPALAQASHVQFTALRSGGWRAAPMQERRIAPNAVSIDWLEGRPYIEFDANFAQFREGAGDVYDIAFDTPLGRFNFYPEVRAPGVQLADGRIWRAALSHASPDGCIVLQASQTGSAVMISGPFTTHFPKYQYHVIDLCSPANRAIAAAG